MLALGKDVIFLEETAPREHVWGGLWDVVLEQIGGVIHDRGNSQKLDFEGDTLRVFSPVNICKEGLYRIEVDHQKLDPVQIRLGQCHLLVVLEDVRFDCVKLVGRLFILGPFPFFLFRFLWGRRLLGRFQLVEEQGLDGHKVLAKGVAPR